MESKKRYKLYKKGKLWCCSAIVLVTAFIGMGVARAAHADDSSMSPQVVTETQSVNAASQALNNNSESNANYGNLDGYQLTANPDTGNLNLDFSGWQASGQSNTERYRYAILFDNTTNSEISRQTIGSVERSDVAQAYPDVPNSQTAGFSSSFSLPSTVIGHEVSLITRYSDDPNNGEGNYTNYWFSPINIDAENKACLDNIRSNNGQVTVSGWHATNLAAGKKYHYIIAFDQTMGKEIARQLTGLGQRPDVAQVFPTIGNAAFSGFSTTFNLTPEYSQDNVQFISRWTDDPAGNGNSVDYWFAPVEKINQGNLDLVDLSNGQLTVAGWHANDVSVYQPYHYLILIDTTTGQQIAAAQVPTKDSNDVAAAFPGILTAGKSRFNYDFGKLDNLQVNHSYTLISRYSLSDQGSGDSSAYTDYQYSLGEFNRSVGVIDGYYWTSGNQMSVTGWMASDTVIDEPNPYLIVLRDGKEVMRQKLTLDNRYDVAAAYPQIYGSLQSGFKTIIQLPDSIDDGDLQFVLRFSDSENGEGNHTDIWTNAIKDGFKRNYTLNNNKLIDGVLYRFDSNGNVLNRVNPSNIQISRISFDGDLAGISKDEKKNVKVKLALTNGGTVDAWATVKWQGNSTLAWPKKGYRIKLFKDEAMTKKLKLKLPGSGFKTNSFNLKANFVDPTAGLNIVNAKLFSEVTASRAGLAESIVATMPNYGQVAGLPVELDINNYDQGLYVLETYQEDKLYDLDDKNVNDIALSDQQSPLSQFTQPFTPANLQEAEFEAKSPAKVDQSVADKFNELYTLANASDSDYQALEDEYLDVPAAIDYIAFSAAINNVDGITKNITYINKDNGKWVLMPYDLDESWDSNWRGINLTTNDNFIDTMAILQNRLLLAIYNHHQQDIINRYKQLRQTALSTENVTNLFNQWFDEVGTTAYQNNDRLWGDINITGQKHRLAIDKTTFDNIISQRLAAVDQQFGL